MRPEAGRLRTQLLRWLLVPLLALLAVDAAVSVWVAQRVAQQAQDKALREIAHELSLMVRPGPAGSLVLEVPEAARRVLLEDPEDRVSFELVNAGGQRLAGETIPLPPSPAPNPRTGEVLYDTQLTHGPVRAVQIPLTAETGAVLRVAETRHQRDAIAREIVAAVIVPQVLLIALAGLIVRTGVVRGLRPLQDLQRAVAARSHKDLSPLDEQQVPVEVRPLVQSVNALLLRLEQVLQLQSRFIADAAHQLKTPVAGLKAHIELLARQPEPAEREALVARLNMGAERLSRLVSQLLSLARNEPEAARMIDFRPVDLNALLLDIAAQWVPQALKRGIDLGLEAPEAPVSVHGDAGRLRELFDNLLDNAIRYSEEGGRVTVRVSDAPTPTVSVSDDGPRIPPEQQQRVFERFHRLLGSGDGSGLGLAIAQEIARLHDARILVQDDADGVGNRFIVVFATT
ncbi:MAG: sensor histidine kinase N-terminal domain-containing protein [Rubrivivax sp.]